LRTYAASGIDQQFAGARVQYIAGPLNIRGLESLKRSVRLVSARGPEHRIGLHPDRTSRKWKYGPDEPSVSVTEVAPTSSQTEVAETLRKLAELPFDFPITIRVCGDYIHAVFDHGIGDAHYMQEIVALLTGDEEAALQAWPTPSTRYPALVALRHVMHSDRSGLVSAMRGLLDRQRTRSPADTDVVERLSEAQAVAFARSNADFVESVRALSKQGASASITSMVITAVIRSLRMHGIEPKPTAGVLIDLRRYLPDGAVTLSNFVAIVPVSTAVESRAADLEKALMSEMTSYRPLVAHAAAQAKLALKRPADVSGPWLVESPAQRARLNFSDATATRGALKKFSWACDERGDRTMAAMLPLTFSDQITVTMTRVGSGFQLTASFFASQFDENKIQGALSAVLSDPGMNPELWRS
jgi:NRPS condensation-like uncharacterized protein